MSHNGPTQAGPCGPMASQRSQTVNFVIPLGAGGMERDIHRLRYGLAITSTVCVPRFLPPGWTGSFVRPTVMPSRLCGRKECCRRSTYHYVKGQWDDCFLIHWFYHYFKSSYDSCLKRKKVSFLSSNECTSDKWNAAVPAPAPWILRSGTETQPSWPGLVFYCFRSVSFKKQKPDQIMCIYFDLFWRKSDSSDEWYSASETALEHFFHNT